MNMTVKTGALAITLALILTGCSNGDGGQPATAPPAGETQAPDSGDAQSGTNPPAGAAGNSATFSVGDKTFEFVPTMCSMGAEDIMVEGPGSDTQSGMLAFLEVDFVKLEGNFEGGADINLGTDRPFTSPDDYYRLDTMVIRDGFKLTVDGNGFTTEGTFYVNGEPASEAGSSQAGVLTVSCGAH